jgi:hypothetical protein
MSIGGIRLRWCLAGFMALLPTSDQNILGKSYAEPASEHCLASTPFSQTILRQRKVEKMPLPRPCWTDAL